MSRLFAVCIWLLMASQVVADVCREDRVELRGPWGQAAFTIEIADDPEEQSLGLMHRSSMPQSAGMLFVYEKASTLRFWMRNTLIELDMLFIDPRGVVRHIHNRAQPHDETPISGGPGMIAVLEINGGLAERLGITAGTEMRHPVFGSTAAWPC